MRDMREPAANVMETPAAALAHPLDAFYAAAGQPLPELTQVPGHAVPEPYKSLLVHQDDMTPTLEKFHQSALHLEVLGRRHQGEAYFREVILRLDRNQQPVEFGAILIHLDRFSGEAREQILREHLPLGHILHRYQISHTSRPRAYLRFAPDQFIARILELDGPRSLPSPALYGRRNTLYDSEQKPLAEIIEILPPVQP